MNIMKCGICGGKLNIDKDKMISMCPHCGAEQPLDEEIQDRIKRNKIQLQEQQEEKLNAEIVKSFKTKLFIAFPIICVLVVLIIFSVNILIPAVKYNKANNLINDKQYLNAAKIFQELEGYKDSKTKMRECSYLQSVDYINAKEYRNASLILVTLGEYKDSKKLYEQYKFYELKTGDIIKLGSYEQDNNLINGKGEISWRVLTVDERKALLISDKSLECMEYSDDVTVTWEVSSIRKWLNNEFFNNTFSEEEQKKILPMQLHTEDTNKYKSATKGSDTVDKVFLLSENELNLYLPNKTDRLTKPTEYAKSKHKYGHYEYATYDWWLRTYNTYEKNAAYVSTGGYISYYNRDSRDVRPAIWVKLDTAE
ncbi:MAG: hypothetical protein GYA50_08120 [Eubacteriaceae bacterium]|nr:hypothetical protein [Eubacteriaceae bacterium]